MQEEGLCNIAFSMGICRLTLAWISSENSTTYKERWLILTGLPSLRLDPISCQLVSLLSGVDWPLSSPFANCFLSVPLSNSSHVPLPTSGHVEISSPNPLFSFAPKQTKGSSAWRTTYVVLHKFLYFLFSFSFIFFQELIKLVGNIVNWSNPLGKTWPWKWLYPLQRVRM